MSATDAKMKINEVVCWCKCGWKGTVEDTEPGDDGELLCPNCDEEVKQMFGGPHVEQK